jgi:hypothetical protein
VTRRRAFIIGENGPSEGAVKPLTFAEQDALRLAETLSSDMLGYHVHVSVQRSAAEHLYELDAFASESQRGDLLLIYFSGHGYLPKTGLYLLCGTTHLTSRLVTTAIPLSTIRSILENCIAGTKVLILDCCHSGAAVGQPWGTKGAADNPGNRLDTETRDSASLVIAASERFSTARESAELGGGIMTSFLIEAFKAPDRSDKDRDGRLSVADTMEWLRLRTRAYNAMRDVVDQIDVPILYGDLRGDVFLTPELATFDSARASETIRASVAEVRAAFATGRRVDIRVLQTQAKPIGICSPTLTSVAVVDEILTEGDDAALFCAAIIIYVRRESRYVFGLIEALGPHVRDEALWRILRALRRIVGARSLPSETRDVLLYRLLAIARDPGRLREVEFGPNSVPGKIVSLLEHLNIPVENIFAPEQLAKRLPSGDRGKLRQWNGNIRLYYEGRDCRLKASSYTMFVDFLDEVYERLRTEGSQILAYTYGVDWILES